jgi:hypothetical protein
MYKEQSHQSNTYYKHVLIKLSMRDLLISFRSIDLIELDPCFHASQYQEFSVDSVSSQKNYDFSYTH